MLAILRISISAQSSVSVTKMSQQLLKAVKAIGFPVPGVCLVFPLLEGPPAVGAHEAPGVELVPHRRDNSVLARLGADTTLILRWRIVWNIDISVTSHLYTSHQETYQLAAFSPAWLA